MSEKSKERLKKIVNKGKLNETCFICGKSDFITELEFVQAKNGKVKYFHRDCMKDW